MHWLAWQSWRKQTKDASEAVLLNQVAIITGASSRSRRSHMGQHLARDGDARDAGPRRRQNELRAESPARFKTAGGQALAVPTDVRDKHCEFTTWLRHDADSMGPRGCG